PRISAAWSPNLSPRVPSVIPPGTDLSYSWSQAFSDLGQIAPIVTLTGFMLFALILDLVLPRSRRDGAVAIAAVVGFAYALGIACGFVRTDFRCQEAGAKYLLVGGFASAFVLYGMALIYGGAVTTVLPDIAQRLSSSAASNPVILLGILLMGVGFAFKVSAA